jgi:hypothetical protein
MNPRYKRYLRINLISLFFIVLSFISVTLAWFAYSGLSTVSTDVGVKAWYIELEKNGESISNNIVISLSEISPGMETLNEVVKIKNMGDTDAQIKYSIVSARILDDPNDNYVVDNETITSDYVEDILAHEYPFHLNISLSKNYVLSKGEESIFEVSVSWPLDSGHDALDSKWGSDAYKFQLSEEEKRMQDENYQVRPPIQIVISVIAEQYIDKPDSSDVRYNLGDMILFDVVDNKKCTELSDTCLATYVIDVDNKLGDEVVTLMPTPKKTYLNGIYNNYDTLFSTITNDWTVEKRPLMIEDLLRIVSKDVMNSVLVRENLSDAIIGNLKYQDRIQTEIERATNEGGYYVFEYEKFEFLSSNVCYWTKTEYNNELAFALKNIDQNQTKIYGELKNTNCNVVPVILANKNNL